ncbi:MAG: DNA mismatch repair endonuclease MutL [Bacteroidales bacterium]|nr:DNA mismatch repair endonuclease MutL [Bacteroidales bacterium]MCB8998602.1 DNA mismatch repair endonuclease MutL [Bacteroidales bacterium]MCB9012530.1 DNA mismatch repair endonuclease MutL [Bacteroidales bacterium]
MSDIIQLLPDAVANQIAAGEVIQRPASVVKELVENAVDSGAKNITVNVKDSGRTLVQVIDDGSGMSETDARVCWERHATSKIRKATDLFSIRTKGFRGEALASIAAIAEVSLKTRRKEDELGTHIRINASEIQLNESVSCPEGSNFSVKNLFYNIPARRKFLKSNTTELRHIITEFNHIALAHPGIEFSLIHNNSQIYNLPKSNLRQRIISIFGKNLNQNLIPLQTDTSLVKIDGFIGKPEFAKKTYGEQFFFVNNRFIRHPYFHKAVLQAYQQILPQDAIPSYFIFFESDPEKIDINIHPTKTEIKFEDELAIWQILLAVVKESIGKYNLMPSLDFNTEGVIDIPVMRSETEIRTPEININREFNPFDNDPEYHPGRAYRDRSSYFNTPDPFERARMGFAPEQQKIPSETNPDRNEGSKFLQLKNRYILTAVKSGIMIIDQKRAHERILYEENLNSLAKDAFTGQQTLFPETIELNHADYVTFISIIENVNRLGFDVRDLGNNAIIVNGIPSTVKNADLKDIIEELLETYKSCESDMELEAKEKVARAVARASAIPYGKVLEQQEMRNLVDQLFACSNPNYSPSGKPVISIISMEEIEKLL